MADKELNIVFYDDCFHYENKKIFNKETLKAFRDRKSKQKEVLSKNYHYLKIFIEALIPSYNFQLLKIEVYRDRIYFIYKINEGITDFWHYNCEGQFDNPNNQIEIKNLFKQLALDIINQELEMKLDILF